jgi:plasmid replication initiation protein
MENIGDLLERLRDKASAAKGSGAPRLLPNRHPVRDFFIADIVDWALKDDQHTMEHPFFCLSKTPDHRIRHYEHNGNTVTIKPGADGLANIWDKDILIYAISQLVQGINQGRNDVGHTLHVTAYDLLVATNRYTGGKNYDQLADAFRRLTGTRIETDIKTNGIRQREGFGLLDGWKIIERNSHNGRMAALELRLSDWLYNAVIAGEVLTLNRDYFRLAGGLQRRLYELARKHCGYQAKWAVNLELLQKKTGSAAALKEFRRLIRKISHHDGLPDYRMRYEELADQIIFYAK